MPPYLPVLAISRSQNVRIGRGPGNTTVPELSMGDTPGVNIQAGGLQVPFYIDLGDGNSRKDLQHHSTLGSLITVGPISLTVSSDLFRSAGLAVTAGSGTAINVASGVVKSRTFGGTLNVSAAPGLAVRASSTTLDRTDLVVVNEAGVVSVTTGTAAATGTSVAPPAGPNNMPIATVLVPANASAATGYTIAVAYPTA